MLVARTCRRVVEAARRAELPHCSYASRWRLERSRWLAIKWEHRRLAHALVGRTVLIRTRVKRRPSVAARRCGGRGRDGGRLDCQPAREPGGVSRDRALHRGRQRRAGLRPRPSRICASLAARCRGSHDADAERRLTRGTAVPQRAAGHGLPGALWRGETKPIKVHSDKSRPGTRASTTRPSRTAATSTSPPVTGPSSPSTSTCRRSRTRPDGGITLPSSYDQALPHADRVLGVRVRRPGRPRQRHRPARQLDGFAVVDVNMRGTGCSGGRSTTSSRSRASMGTTSSRPSPTSPGSKTTGSG